MARQQHIRFRDSQIQRNAPLDPDVFEGDRGYGEYNGKHDYPFVLSNPERNLWRGMREEAIRYFNGVGLGTNRAEGLSSTQIAELEADGVQYFYPTDVQFWGSPGRKIIDGKACKLPTGHILSSQVACINHLFPLIRDREAATRLLHEINILVCEALPVDIHERGNYVEFEVVGGGSYLNEEKGGKPLKRGANCTSVDAVMKGRTRDGEIVLFLIEWKYVEEYMSAKSKWDDNGGPERQRRYRSFFTKDNSPFTFCNSEQDEEFFRQLFTEPYYQLMRQTLLGWQMLRDSEKNGDVTSIEHIVVIPSCNYELRQNSKPLGGTERKLAQNWNPLVKFSVLFRDPQSLFESLAHMSGRGEWIKYLTKRYWAPSFTITEKPPQICKLDCIRLVHDVEFTENGQKYTVPKGTIGCAIEVWNNGAAYEFDTSLVITLDDGTLDYMFCTFSVDAEDVEISYCHLTGQYYPPKG